MSEGEVGEAMFRYAYHLGREALCPSGRRIGFPRQRPEKPKERQPAFRSGSFMWFADSSLRPWLLSRPPLSVVARVILPL